MFLTDNEKKEKVYVYLDNLGIKYDVVYNQPIFTSNRDVEEFKGVDVLDIKNLFFKGYKGKNHYLVILPYDKQLDIKNLSKLIKEKSLSFGSEERLFKYLGLDSGAVSIFGLLNDIENEVILIIDEDILKTNNIGFHPNISTETLIFMKADLEKILGSLKNKIRYIKFD